MNNVRYEIRAEETAENPRLAEGKIGHFAFAHHKYNLGDEDQTFSIDQFENWDEVEEMLRKERGAFLALKTSMTDHSSQQIYLGKPRSAWDSGVIGFCWMSKEEVVDLCGSLEEDSIAAAKKALEDELVRYNAWRNGEIYEAVIFDENDEPKDIFGGFLSEEEAKEYVERLIKEGHWN